MYIDVMSRYRVTLTEDEKKKLLEITNKGAKTPKMFKHARALLLCDQGDFADYRWSVYKTAEAVGLTPRSIINIRQRFVEEGLDSALRQKQPDTPRPRIFDGAFEARLTQLACSTPPDGRVRWTVRLLASKLVELQIVDSVSTMTVQRALKKTHFSLM